jgi:hypothetical protein
VPSGSSRQSCPGAERSDTIQPANRRPRGSHLQSLKRAGASVPVSSRAIGSSAPSSSMTQNSLPTIASSPPSRRGTTAPTSSGVVQVRPAAQPPPSRTSSWTCGPRMSTHSSRSPAAS